jgi:hypothetical protein
LLRPRLRAPQLRLLLAQLPLTTVSDRRFPSW